MHTRLLRTVPAVVLVAFLFLAAGTFNAAAQ
jgi:hypothetical protein